MALDTAFHEPISDVGYAAHRLTVTAEVPFDDFRRRYEQAVPAFDAIRGAVAHESDWSAVTDLVNSAAPHGFLRYWSSDVTPLMRVAGAATPCANYLMGNHTIAEQMFRHNPSVMAYVPMQMVITVDADSRSVLAIDQPGAALAAFGHPDITAVGVQLDRKLAALLHRLGAPVPPALTTS